MGKICCLCLNLARELATHVLSYSHVTNLRHSCLRHRKVEYLTLRVLLSQLSIRVHVEWAT